MGRINTANIKKTIYFLKRNGVMNTWYAAKERMEEAAHAPYIFQAPNAQELDRQRTTPLAFDGMISIVVPAYHTVPEYLRELIDSVLHQTYPHWELILADASADDSVEKVVRTYSDERIRYHRLAENAGIARNTNQALEYANGEYIGLLDHDDVLTENALYEMTAAIEIGKKAGIDIKMLYSDEDKCNSDCSEYYEPNFKEDFNLDLLLSNNYICHFLVMEAAFMKKLCFRAEYDGAQDYDLVLRAAECLMEDERQIVHIPKVLYHWRCHTGSTAENPQSKQYAYEAGKKALQDFADRRSWNAKAEHLKHLGFYKLTYLSECKTEPHTILMNRKDVGAVGGRLLKRNHIAAGRMDEAGKILYEGLHAAYSGYLHRAVLSQDAEVVDIRVMSVREECIPIFEQITGVTYQENAATGLFDVSVLPQGTDYKNLSVKVCRALREAGYRILYQPVITVKER